ncbi:MAG: threonine--tRNA ligase [SAR202 cluster bacterium]|nr:threonine--tRNA ligase [SAR202 cluster bacterium]|tara:strand:+ start:5124 stop:6848 length:1725 start_codon:yes stop_codon:yes gene_type:complete
MVQNPKEDLIELRKKIRHSTAHVMADVVTRMFPNVKLAIGPPTEDGFYYDFLTETPFTDQDIKKIEKGMKKVIQRNLIFELHEYSRDEALDLNDNEPLKLEIISEIPKDEKITTYKHGLFEDLCAGPHVESTGKIPAFKLLSVAGAYWRGDENNHMLQRIYGTAFESKEELEKHLDRIEEAKKRDHRVLGKQLDLFSIHDEVGSGLVIWHPKGSRLRGIIEDYWKKKHYDSGYDLIYTPHIGRSNLWEVSGHLEFFKENMFDGMDMEGQDYYLKPMNCPFHIMYYQSDLRSYRDLPMRIGEIGTVYRYERGGVLHGLTRVRGLTQDDAHIFCTEDQIEAEVNSVLDLTDNVLKHFDLKPNSYCLSTRPSKAVGDDQQWQIATESLRKTMESRGLSYEIDDGGGAFYGPKIDVNIQDALGREWQCSTIQFDFNLPERFSLKYIGSDGEEKKPYMVHRTLLGSMERFIGVLIEHYGGAFPFWLAPVQIVIIPIADKHHEYAKNLESKLLSENIRVFSDNRNQRMNLKIREAQLLKIPYMLIIGDQEMDSETISVRIRDDSTNQVMNFDQLLSLVKV